MRSHRDPELTRRTLLQLGFTGAALAALPWPFEGVAGAAGDPHLLVTFYADGGWDVTQVFDVHDPNDSTDGVDIDVPQGVSGLPPSVITSTGPITYMSNPATRPNVDTFFTRWADRSAIVNGIGTRSTSHSQSTQLTLTGYLDPTRADFAVMAAHRNGPDLPLPHLLVSGPSFGGPFAGMSGRTGGQLGQALAYNVIPRHGGSGTQLGVSAIGEAYVQQALARQRTLERAAPAGAVTGKLDQYYDAQERGDKLARLASSLPSSSGQGAQLATALAAAFRQGLTTSVTLRQAGGFDTHNDNTDQNARWESLFGFLDAFVTGLAAEPGLAHPSLLDETTVVYVSEFGRTPRLNGSNGKDHHPWNSMLFVGKNVRPGVYGLTDSRQVGVKVNLATGQPDNAGQVLDVTHLVAGTLVLAGANAADYLPNGVQPFTAMVA